MKGKDMRLAGRKAVILGGAGRIGSAIAVEYVAHGAEVLLVDKEQQSLDALLAKQPPQLRGRFHAIAADVRGEEDAARLAAAARDKLGAVDVYIHSAGYVHRSPFVEHSLEELDRLWDANVRVVFATCRAFARIMVEQKRGRIIVFGAVGGLRPEIGHAGYCAAKAALVGFARVAAVELARNNIRVNIIAPGPTETVPFKSRYYLDHPEMLAGIESRTPMGRIGHPEDQVGLAVFLASDESAWITGQVLYCDGGLSLV